MDTVKILVFSDSHGKIDLMADMVQKQTPDFIFHLGDYHEDAEALHAQFPDIPLHAVRGNCDFRSETPDLEELKLRDKTILLTHGHRYHVKESYDALQSMGQDAGADLLLFGHTHIPYYARIDNMHVLNPGSARAVCALVEIKEADEITCTHLPLIKPKETKETRGRIIVPPCS